MTAVLPEPDTTATSDPAARLAAIEDRLALVDCCRPTPAASTPRTSPCSSGW